MENFLIPDMGWTKTQKMGQLGMNFTGKIIVICLGMTMLWRYPSHDHSSAQHGLWTLLTCLTFYAIGMIKQTQTIVCSDPTIKKDNTRQDSKFAMCCAECESWKTFVKS